MPGELTLEELAAQAQQGDTAANAAEFESAMAQQGTASTQPTSRNRPRARNGTGQANNQVQVSNDPTPSERRDGLVVVNVDTPFNFTDSRGEAVTATIAAGQRMHAGHEHDGAARRPSCAACMAIWEHERQLRQSRQANERQTSRRTTEADEMFDMVDSAGSAYQITVPAGQTIVTREDHEHSAKRVPTCALCMAIYAHEQEIRPPRQASSSQPKECECACGEMTSGGRFRPGHDARLYGRVNRYNAWAEENSEKIESGEVPFTSWPQYALIPEAVRQAAELRTGHGVIALLFHEPVETVTEPATAGATS